MVNKKILNVIFLILEQKSFYLVSHELFKKCLIDNRGSPYSKLTMSKKLMHWVKLGKTCQSISTNISDGRLVLFRRKFTVCPRKKQRTRSFCWCFLSPETKWTKNAIWVMMESKKWFILSDFGLFANNTALFNKKSKKRR